MIALKKSPLYLLLLLLLPTAALTEPEIWINYIYYTVAGYSAEQLWKNIMAKTPVKEKGNRHVAYTKWYVKWQFWWLEKENSCEISKVKTRLDITYTLPKLKPASSMPDSLISRWQQYYAALFQHEQGHKDLGVKAANEIEKQISDMGPRSDCKQLELDANAIGRRVIKEYDRIENEYDRSTNHGMNTGAVIIK